MKRSSALSSRRSVVSAGVSFANNATCTHAAAISKIVPSVAYCRAVYKHRISTANAKQKEELIKLEDQLIARIELITAKSCT